MRRLLVRGLWRLFGRRLGWRLGWVALATAARTMLRRGSSRRVDEAAADLEQRLPESVRGAIVQLPGDPIRRGGQVVAAGRSARQVASGAGRATRLADDGRRRVVRGFDRASTLVDGRPRPGRAGRALGQRLGVEIQTEAERSRRQLRSEMLANSRGRAAADDALLDRRSSPGGQIDVDDHDLADHDLDDHGSRPPAPVRAGRWRAPRRRRTPPVGRVQRSYRRPGRPWDR